MSVQPCGQTSIGWEKTEDNPNISIRGPTVGCVLFWSVEWINTCKNVNLID